MMEYLQRKTLRRERKQSMSNKKDGQQLATMKTRIKWGDVVAAVLALAAMVAVFALLTT
jgi:hypothetical protein